MMSTSSQVTLGFRGGRCAARLRPQAFGLRSAGATFSFSARARLLGRTAIGRSWNSRYRSWMVELLHLGDQPRPKLVRNWQNGGVILLVKIRRSAPVYGWFTE